MKKSAFRMLMLLLLMAALFILPVSAVETSGFCGYNGWLGGYDNATWVFDEATATLTISGTGTVGRTPENEAWTHFEGTIQRVVVNEGITGIGLESFRDCVMLTDVSLPASVVEINDGAFWGCRNLKAITLPSQITVIGYNAFRDCSELESIEIPAHVTTLGQNAFLGCAALKSVALPESVASVGNDTFSGCISLEKATLSPNMPAVSKNMFQDCKKLKTVTIPEGIKEIQDCAFWNCPALESIDLPDSVTVIGYMSFHDCKNLTSIEIPKYVTVIDRSAFNGCEKLSSVSFPKGLIEIGDNAFYQCYALSSIDLPEALNKIGPYAFAYCDKLEQVYIPENVHWIGSFAFGHCPKLDQVFIPKSVTSILASAFTANEGLDVYYQGSEEDWNELVDLSSLHDWADIATFHYNATGIPEEPEEEKPEEDVTPTNPFTDVKPGAYYEEAVLWAVETEVTKGVTETTFSPDTKCNRAQVVTFLWRAAGSPKPTSANNPFVDVEEGKYYTEAVLWAVENGITAGMDDTHFGTNAECTRGQVATFLWRVQNKPQPTSTDNPFTDTKPGAYYYDAVLWAVEAEVTKGVTDTTFAPNTTCTRGQIVTFLYRALG